MKAIARRVGRGLKHTVEMGVDLFEGLALTTVVAVRPNAQGGDQRRGDAVPEWVEDADIEDVTVEANPEVAERHAELTEDVDDLLDEIDSVLEENAEEFVRGYVQKGGQ